MKDSSFDRKKLREDVLNAISQFCAGKKFPGYNGEKYVILSGNENAAINGFVDVTLKIVATNKFVTRYALVLIGLG